MAQNPPPPTRFEVLTVHVQQRPASASLACELNKRLRPDQRVVAVERSGGTSLRFDVLLENVGPLPSNVSVDTGAAGGSGTPSLPPNREFRTGQVLWWDIKHLEDIVSNINHAGGNLAFVLGRGWFMRDYTLSGSADDLQRFRTQLTIDTMY